MPRTDTELLDFIQENGDTEFSHWLVECSAHGIDITRSNGNYIDDDVSWPAVESEDFRSAVEGMMDIFEEMQQGSDGGEDDGGE